jgi:hypothetical protein
MTMLEALYEILETVHENLEAFHENLGSGLVSPLSP